MESGYAPVQVAHYGQHNVWLAQLTFTWRVAIDMYNRDRDVIIGELASTRQV